MYRCNTDEIISLIVNHISGPSPPEPVSLQTLEAIRPTPTPGNQSNTTELNQVGLVFKDHLFTKTKVFEHKCICNAMSPTGRLVAWFSKTKFSIYQIRRKNVSLFCTGILRKKEYLYGQTEPPALRQDHEHGDQLITCAALSENYVAIGTNKSLLIMALQTNPPGKWLCAAEHGYIEKVAFSPSGDQLLVLPSYKAIIHSTSDFAQDPRRPNNAVKFMDGLIVAEWRNSVCEVVDTVFASDGNMAAICTSHDNTGQSHIRLLKKSSRRWRKYREHWIQVKHRRDSTRGMCNMALYTSPLMLC